MYFFLLLVLALLTVLPLAFASGAHGEDAPPTVYIIRHGEKPTGRGDKGLNVDGFKRAECLRSVFGQGSGYEIGHIMAPFVNKKGHHRRPYETVLPLAVDLGLDVDTSCKRKQAKCVARKVRKYHGPGEILISWRHTNIHEIARELGVPHPPMYPERYDLIWVIPFPYDNITEVRSEACPGLDVPAEIVVQGV
ncbi:hypothetical protein ARAM_004710 [Aspergillus rambellii]|uniref:Phosphoglycerate mutase family protein n=1 Tax=Aspergillus rambellii TaxID=308745 RepID=A0A0F8VDB9_9EURO|nr:hypothetical protein ARAM_004710 [Aspergillus rambellii]